MSAYAEGTRNALLAGVLALCVTVAANAAAAKNAIDEVKLSAKRCLSGWSLASEYVVPAQSIKQFETRFNATILAILNQLFMAKGAGVKINYILCPTLTDVARVYSRLAAEVGTTNIITHKKNVVVEIVAVDKQLKKEALAFIKVSPLQNYELKAVDLPAGWFLLREVLCCGNELEKMGKKFNAPLNEVINQLFQVNGKRIQINYLLCARQEDAGPVCKKMREVSGKDNIILCRNGIVTEIISGSTEIKKQAEQILAKKP